MRSRRRVEIVGGGLAGLSLGLALRRADVPVTIFEAGTYPRHRVCGEFIAGLDTVTRERLGLSPFLCDSRQHRSLAWFDNDQSAGISELPEPALGLSRHALDCRLAEAFVAAGGELKTNTRVATEATPEGRVIAAGRRRQRSRWIGLKVHVENLATRADLELHLGRDAYVGLSAIEGKRINICGLFRTKVGTELDQSATPLEQHLRASGLISLADRLAAAELDPTSISAVAALSFSRPSPRDRRMLIGDAFAMIPPFTGNGMAMAFQSAASALDPLVSWSQNQLDWNTAVRTVRRRLRRRFSVRLVVADMLHRFVHSSPPQRWFLAANRSGLLPFRPLYRILH